MNKSFAILFGAVLTAGVTSVGCQSNEGAVASENGGDSFSTVIDTRDGDNGARDNATADNQSQTPAESAPTANVGTDNQPEASAEARNDAGENVAKPEDHDYEADGGTANVGETSVIDTTDGAKTESVADVNADTENTQAPAPEGDAPEAGVKDSETNTEAGTDKASDAGTGTGEAAPDSGAATSGND